MTEKLFTGTLNKNQKKKKKNKKKKLSDYSVHIFSRFILSSTFSSQVLPWVKPLKCEVANREDLEQAAALEAVLLLC